MKHNIYRGQVYLADLSPTVGCEQGGRRPVLIVQNDLGNKYSTTVIVAPISSKYKNKHKLPTHQLILPQNGLTKHSTVLLEQIRVIDKSRILRYLDTLSKSDMINIDRKLITSLGINKDCL